MTKEVDDLKKAIEIAEGATGVLKKSQMALDFSTGPNPHQDPSRSKYDRLAKKAAEQTEVAVQTENSGGSDTAHMHYSAGQAHADASKEASRTGKPNLAAYHQSQAEAHHKAYTRTSVSGKVSQIQAKGVQTHQEMVNELHDAFERHDRKGRGGLGIATTHPDFSTPEKYKRTLEAIKRNGKLDTMTASAKKEISDIIDRHLKA